MSVNVGEIQDTNISLGNDSSFDVEFSQSPNIQFILIGAELYQDPEQHERLVLYFKGNPFTDDTVIVSGDPVKFTYGQGDTSAEFYGYVHTVHQENGPRLNRTTVECVSSSYLMKNTNQKIYKGLTADQIVSKVAATYGFKAITQRHARVRNSIVQSGQSDWQLLRSLAKQTGYALLANNTSITFVSKGKIYADKKDNAPYFNYVNSETTGITNKYERLYGTVVSFNPHISDEAPEMATRVDRKLSGRNLNTESLIQATHPYKDATLTSLGVVIPGETYFE